MGWITGHNLASAISSPPRLLLAGVATATILLAPLANQAKAVTLTSENYPSTAGASASGTGSTKAAGGKTYTYTIANPGIDSLLYFGGLDPILGGAQPIRSGLDGTLGNMTFSTISGNTATWIGSTSFTYSNNGGASFQTATVQTEFLLTVTSGNAPVTAASVGAPSSVGAVTNISGLSSFAVNEQFLAANPIGGSFEAFDTLFNSDYPHHTGSCISGGCEVTSFSGGFYSLAADVPEPASLAVVGAGIAMIGVVRRKSRIASPG
jgi:hypothetical protein